MPTNLALRLSAVSHALISRNRKVRTQESPWGKAVVVCLVLAAVGITCMCLFWAWSNLHSTTLNYQISQALETQKELLDLNRKLRVELSNLTAIARLEELAATYEMGPPTSGQVVKVKLP